MYPVTRSLLASRCFLCVIMFSVLLLLWSKKWKPLYCYLGGDDVYLPYAIRLHSGLTVTRFVCSCLSLLCASVELMGLCRSSLVPSWVNVLSICPWSRSKTIETNAHLWKEKKKSNQVDVSSVSGEIMTFSFPAKREKKEGCKRSFSWESLQLARVVVIRTVWCV